jgi:hypothetical protein
VLDEEFARVASLSSAADSGPSLRLAAKRSGLAARFAAVTPAPIRNSRLLLFGILRLSVLSGGAELLDSEVVDRNWDLEACWKIAMQSMDSLKRLNMSSGFVPICPLLSI